MEVHEPVQILQLLLMLLLCLPLMLPRLLQHYLHMPIGHILYSLNRLLSRFLTFAAISERERVIRLLDVFTHIAIHVN